MPIPAFAIAGACVVFYAARFGLAAVKMHRDTHAFYAVFFGVIVATLLVMTLRSVYDGGGDTRYVLQTTMLWTVLGPLIDLLWSGTWPGSGSLALWTAQLVFVLEVGVGGVYGKLGCALLALSTMLFVLGMVFEKRVLQRFFPASEMLDSKHL